MLGGISRHRVTGELEAEVVGHHAAAGQVAPGLGTEADQVVEPAQHSLLHGDRRRPDGVFAEVLVERRGDEVAEGPDRQRRRGDQPEVAGVVDVCAVRQQPASQLAQDLPGVHRPAWRRLVEEPLELGGLDVGKQRPVLDTVEVIGQQVHDLMTRRTELVDVHCGFPWGLPW